MKNCKCGGNVGGAFGFGSCCQNAAGNMTCHPICPRPTEPDSPFDFASFVQAGTTYTPTPAGVPITLTAGVAADDTDITPLGTGIRLPAGKYIVNYSFEGTASAADTLQIVPTLNGTQIVSGARSDIQTADDLQANMNGVFAVSAMEGSTLGFNLVDPIAAAGTTVSNTQMSVTVQKVE